MLNCLYNQSLPLKSFLLLIDDGFYLLVLNMLKLTAKVAVCSGVPLPLIYCNEDKFSFLFGSYNFITSDEPLVFIPEMSASPLYRRDEAPDSVPIAF